MIDITLIIILCLALLTAFIAWICRLDTRSDLELAMSCGWTKEVKAILIVRRRWLSKQVLRDAEFWLAKQEDSEAAEDE